MLRKEKKVNCFKIMILLLIASQVILISGCAKKARKQSSPFDKKAVLDAIDKNHDRKIGKKEYRFIWKDKKMAEKPSSFSSAILMEIRYTRGKLLDFSTQ